MSSAYQEFQNQLTELINSGIPLEEVVKIVSQQYSDLEGKAAQALRDKESLERALRQCRRELRNQNQQS